MSNSAITITPQFQVALDQMDASLRTLLITGKAGTGKSTLLSYFRTATLKNVAVLAPTGVAALTVKGQTIHSFCGFKPDITPAKVRRLTDEKRHKAIQRLDTIIIDEISMVRADLLDCLDIFLRKSRGKRALPFGGLHVIFIGDLYQLPPVLSSHERAAFLAHYPHEHFFGAKVFDQLDIEHIELDVIFRQKDENFIRILNGIRTNALANEDLTLLNSRMTSAHDEILRIMITPTNAVSIQENDFHLAKLDGEVFQYQGVIKGTFDTASLPTQSDLILKRNAQVMLLNNDPSGRWVNGTIGVITNIEPGASSQDPSVLWITTAEGRLCGVTPLTWEMFQLVASEHGELESKVVGTFTQYPLRLAWAVTIHKSQGKTFDHVTIDMGRGAFAPGQTYVALSRCTSLQGISLRRPIARRDIIVDTRITDFFTGLKERPTKGRLF